MEIERSLKVERFTRPDLGVVMDEDGEWNIYTVEPVAGGQPGSGVWELPEVDASQVQDCIQPLPRLLSELCHAAAFPEGVVVDWRKSKMRVSGIQFDLVPELSVEDRVRGELARIQSPPKESANGGKGRSTPGSGPGKVPNKLGAGVREGKADGQ